MSKKTQNIELSHNFDEYNIIIPYRNIGFREQQYLNSISAYGLIIKNMLPS